MATVVEKAGDAVSAVGSGAKKVATTVAENPMLAATGAAALGAAVGGTAPLASASRRPRSRPRRGDHLRSDPRARKRRRRVARGSLRQGSRPRGHRRPRSLLPRRLLPRRLRQGRAAPGPRPRASGRHPRRRNEVAQSDNSSMDSLRLTDHERSGSTRTDLIQLEVQAAESRWSSGGAAAGSSQPHVLRGVVPNLPGGIAMDSGCTGVAPRRLGVAGMEGFERRIGFRSGPSPRAAGHRTMPAREARAKPGPLITPRSPRRRAGSASRRRRSAFDPPVPLTVMRRTWGPGAESCLGRRIVFTPTDP